MIHTEIEKTLQKTIFPDLEQGRPGWDLNHTKAVVHHTKLLLDFHKNLDPVVQIIAAYAHDWGYSELYRGRKKYTREEMKEYKQKHMAIGAKFIRDLMNTNAAFGDLTDKQRQRIEHLVNVHDKLDELKDEDEFVLMEADTFGALDSKFVVPTMTKESNERYIASVRRKRIPKFITPEAKVLVEELVEKRMERYQEKS